MMRFLLVTICLAGLTACETSGPGFTSRADPGLDPAFPARADEVIGRTQAACDFIPTVTAVAALLTGGASAPAGTIANGICAEVNKLPRLEADEGPQSVTIEVDGVPVEGLLF